MYGGMYIAGLRSRIRSVSSVGRWSDPTQLHPDHPDNISIILSFYRKKKNLMDPDPGHLHQDPQPMYIVFSNLFLGFSFSPSLVFP